MRRRLLCVLCLATAFLGLPGRAAAQFGAPAPPVIGERYRVEIFGGFWKPTPDLVVSSAFAGDPGTDVDFVADLGAVKERFREFRLVLRPARKHKFRLQYVPIRYTAETALPRDVVFSGARFPAGLPVTSSLTWRAWRFGYEYDFISRSRGFVGLIVEAKYTQVEASIGSTPLSASANARAPIPAIGGIARGYVVENVALTFELTGVKIPERLSEDVRGRYLEWDLYGTANFSEYVGVQVGYRSMDVDYLIEEDAGNLKLRGLYFGGLLRF